MICYTTAEIWLALLALIALYSSLAFHIGKGYGYDKRRTEEWKRQDARNAEQK